MTTSTLVAGVLNGILLGGLYALTALGLSMVFGVMRLVNVAHGELLILAAYLTLSVSSTLGIDPLLSMVPVAFLLFAIGYPIQRWVLNPLMPRGMEPPLLTAFGLSIIAQNLFLIVWKANTRTIRTAYSEETIAFVGVNVPLMYAIAFGLAILLMAGVHAFVSRTYLGKAIRAATEDPETARAMGINVEAIYAMTYSMGAGTAAVGGTLIGMIFSFVPAGGLPWLLKGFVVVVLGGMGNILGTLAGGLILGAAEGIGAAVVGTGYREMVGYLIFLAALILRPRGLFGRAGSQ